MTSHIFLSLGYGDFVKFRWVQKLTEILSVTFRWVHANTYVLHENPSRMALIITIKSIAKWRCHPLSLNGNPSHCWWRSEKRLFTQTRLEIVSCWYIPCIYLVIWQFWWGCRKKSCQLSQKHFWRWPYLFVQNTDFLKLLVLRDAKHSTRQQERKKMSFFWSVEIIFPLIDN